MTKSRPLQYLGLFLLVAAALAVIFFPVGTTPQEQPFTISIQSPKPWLQMADPKEPLPKQADDIFAKAFSDEKLPGELAISTSGGTLASGSTLATVEDRAATQAEARRRAGKVLKALQAKFKDIKLSPETEEQIRQLPADPLFAVGPYAVFPPLQRDGATVPAVKLGLDLQGGVNLVLQVRKALYTYNFDQKINDSADARYKFTARVREALKTAGNSLNEADVNLRPGQDNILEIRTQAANRDEFNAQKNAIDTALKSLGDVKFTLAREPQFFEPEKDKSGAAATFSSGDLLNNMVEIVRSRVDKLGVSEPQIQAQPPDRVIVQLPGVNDPQKAVEAVGKTAQMEIRLMPQNVTPAPDPNDSGNTLFRDQATGQLISPDQIKATFPLIVSGDDLKPKTTGGTLPNGQAGVFFELQASAARRFGEMTARNVGRVMPIFLDERCITAPNINEPITGGSGQISGSMTLEEAKSLAVLLNSGALPAPIDIVENRTVSATLGADSLKQSLRAGLIGLIAVMVFMIVFYRLPGLLANFALIIYCILNLAAFILLGGTLTLPGVAGFLLALAMSLDTNILIFERLREEMAIQPNFSSAVRAAFARAWTAILDSHITTLIAAAVLFFLGTGPVKGFALTLGVGVVLSLFSAISVTRLFLWSIVHIGDTNHRLFAGNIPDAEAVASLK